MDKIKNDDMREIVENYQYQDSREYYYLSKDITTLARYIDKLIQEIENLKAK